MQDILYKTAMITVPLELFIVTGTIMRALVTSMVLESDWFEVLLSRR